MLRRFTTAERLFSRGQRLAARQQYDAAVEAFAQALTLRPRAVGIVLHQALALTEIGQSATAIAMLQEALTWRPDHPVLPLFLAQICFDAADYEQARRWCAHTLTVTPHNPYALGLQALVDLALGHIPQGYARLMQPFPWLMTVAEQVALRLCKSRPPSLVQLANTALNSRLLLWAETYLGQQQTPVRTLSQQLVKLDQALRTSRCLLLLDRLCTRGVMGIQRLALHVRYVGQPAAKALQLRQSAAAEAYYLGDVTTARALYTQLLHHRSELSMARQRLFEVCYEQGEFGAALDYLQPLIPGAAERSAWQASLLGELLYQAGRYVEAAAALQQAVRQELQDFKPFYYLGVCHVRQGAYPQARRCFARAVRLLHPGITALRLEEMYRVYTHAALQPQSCPIK
jgi:tetratricopeptide (TPR) repeat protein